MDKWGFDYLFLSYGRVFCYYGKETRILRITVFDVLQIKECTTRRRKPYPVASLRPMTSPWQLLMAKGGSPVQCWRSKWRQTLRLRHHVLVLVIMFVCLSVCLLAFLSYKLSFTQYCVRRWRCTTFSLHTCNVQKWKSSLAFELVTLRDV